MAVIGSFGDIVFEVSDKKIQSFDGFQRSNEPRWKEHAVIGHKPILEFEGPGVDPITFTVLLRAEFGVNPENQMAKLREFARRGKKALFIRGNKPISVNYWVIKKLSETHKNIDNFGNVMTIEAQLDLLEYVNDSNIEPKKTMSSNQSSTTATSKRATGTMSITVKSVHIRGGPGVDNKVLGYAMQGDKLTVYGEKNGWYSLGGGKYISANSAYSSLKKG